MPQLTVEGFGTFDVPEGTRLVNAIKSHRVDILHRCGGLARCTTCRVSFSAGEPAQMTQAERAKLAEKELLGQARLSCQILCDHDMSVTALMTLSNSGMPDPGPAPAETITPEPVWTTQ